MTGSMAFGGGVMVIWIAFAVTSGEEVHWNNSAGGFWSVASNWDLGRVPNTHDDVIIDSGNFIVFLVYIVTTQRFFVG